MMQIVLATRNQGKLKEMQALMGDLPVTLETQAAHDIPSPEEDGLTFIENALIKARTVCQGTGLAAIGDDSGLVVPALDGAPGIYSARYAGVHGDDAANNAKLAAALATVQDRSAYFYCAMVMLRHAEDPTPLIATAAWHGKIVLQPAGEGGFGYDPHFFVTDHNCTAAQLAPEQKNAISHRGQAIRRICAALARTLE